jgi:sugar lactone lactonase YvrE
MRCNTKRVTFALLLILAGGCEYKSDYVVGPPPTDLPPVEPPAPAQLFPEGLWSASGSPGEIVRLDPSQLLTNGDRTPATKLFTSSANLFTLNSVAFDATGRMWVASADDSLLLAFESGGPDASGFTTPSIIIRPTSRSIAAPRGIAFDKQHGIWVANSASGAIVRFDRSQLGASGSPVPSVTITGVTHPTGLAFDATGALWVSDILANTVSRYLPSQLLESGRKTPAIILSETAEGSLSNPAGIAFDSFNTMWVANAAGESVTAFRPIERAVSGSPSPSVTLRSTGPSLGAPVGLAFDPDGSLWIVGAAGVITKFTLATIGGSGPAEPSVQITVPSHTLFWSIAFWPKPIGFPLN